ncbi:MAG: autotransporter domain-containing protein [Pseudomonadota bacterium]
MIKSSRAAAFSLLAVTLSLTQKVSADIIPTDTFEQDIATGAIIGPITGTTGDINLPAGSGILIDGTGQLIINAGSLFRADAFAHNGTNSLLLDQIGSTLDIGDELNLGRGAGTDGLLTITNGALLTIGGGPEEGFIGSGLTIGQDSGVGAATINNATVIIDRNADNGEVRLTVGRGGDGTLQIENGATVTVQDDSGVIGFLGDGITVAEALPGQAATGLINVDGAGSTLTIDTADLGALVVGVSANGVDTADGTVNVTNGAVVNITGTGFNSGINVARGGNSTGLVRVAGAGSAVNVVGPQGIVGVAVDFGGEVGDGTGTFQVVDSAVVDVRGLTPGNGFFSVGQGTGTGLLEVNTGGIVTVDGAMPISVATASNSSATGTVNIGSGGIINARQVFVGDRGGITVDGAGSQYNIGDELLINQGSGGSASLAVTNGASLTIGGGTESGLSGSGLRVGQGAGTGTALIDNATVVIDRNVDDGEVVLSVGRSGNGNLTIQNGATVTLQDASGVLGARGDGVIVGEASPGFAANGQLTVQGSGSVLTVDTADSGYLTAGVSANGVDSAIGVINILDGAVVNVTGTGANSGINLARGGNSQGTLNLDGLGSTLNVQGVQGFVAIGLDFFGEIGDGDGLLNVTDQAELNISGLTPGQGFLQVGLGTGNGVVEVNTGGVITVDGQVLISAASERNSSQTGRVTINDTGVLNAEAIGVGNRGVLEGTGTINADRLFVFSGGTVNLDSLDVFSEVSIQGGAYNSGSTFDLGVGGDQSLLISEGGQFSAIGDSQFGAAGNASSLTLSDAGTLFDITGAATVNTNIAANSGAVFQAPGGINVGAGGILSGDGGTFVAPTVNINAGGTLGSGNSPGILNVTGNLALNGGDLLFEIAGNAPGEFDVLNVDGDVALNAGTVSVSILDGYNPAGQSFDVLTATGTYTQDPGVSFVSLGAGPDFEYSTRTVGGTTVGAVTFLAFDIGGLPTLSTNQRALALHLDELCPRVEGLADPTVGQLDLDLRCGGIRNGSTTEAQVATALDAISPDEVFGTFQRLLNFTTIQHGNLTRRLNGLRSGATRVDLRNFNVETEDVSISGDELQAAVEELLGEELDRWGFFSDGRFNFGDRDGSSTVPGFDFDTVSLTLGTDYRVRENFVLGAALGYNQVNADFDAGGGVDVNSLTLSFLGTYFRGSSFYVDALASFGWSNVDTTRQIRYTDALGDISRSARGSTDSNQFTAGLGTGYDFSKGRWVFGPHLGINYADITVDAYQEEGATGLNLALPEAGVRSLTANAGLHLSFTTTPSWGVLVPYARLDYVREFQDDADNARVRFANDPFTSGTDATTPFRVTTEGADDAYFIWSVGAHAQFIRGLAAFADYRSVEGLEDMDLGEITVGLRYETKF